MIKKQVALFSKAPIQLCAIFIVPGFLTIAAVLSNAVSDTLMENLLVAVSIFFSVFFAVMSILCSMTSEGTGIQPKDQTKETGSARSLIKETFICAMFESVVSVAVLIFLICYQLLSLSNPWWKTIFQTVILYLVFLIITNMFVILKRLEKLFSEKHGE